MRLRATLLIILCSLLLIFTLGAKTLDPYKVLGVERNASQREIQKAFHKNSWWRHGMVVNKGDKSQHLGLAHVGCLLIMPTCFFFFLSLSVRHTAYDILSDEEKRKNYDLYGDEKGNPGFGPGDTGDQGRTYFRSSGPGQNGFNFRPDEWQNAGGQGGSKSFSFSFGGSGDRNSFGFGGFEDIFSNIFGGGMGGGGQSGKSSNAGRSHATPRSSPKSIPGVNSQVYKKEISGKRMTWLLLSYMPSLKAAQHYESIIQEAADSLKGAVKVGKINCDTELSFCKDLGIYPRGEPRVFVHSLGVGDGGSLVEYGSELSVKSLKAFCQEHLPRFSKRIDASQFEFSSGTKETLPKVMLLSTKKDTPVIWRVLSGLYHKRIAFYNSEVDVSDPILRKLGVNALPSVVGWTANGEKHILKTGISVKDIKSAVQELSGLLDDFEKKNKKVAPEPSKKSRGESNVKQIQLLTGSNFNTLCGETIPVCIIGVFRSSRARDKLETILSSVSQMSFSRWQSSSYSSSDAVSYALLDASKHTAFLNSFDKAGFKSLDKLLVAYKPKKDKFAAYTGDLSAEETEKFVSSVLNGDVTFTKTRQKPKLR